MAKVTIEIPGAEPEVYEADSLIVAVATDGDYSTEMAGSVPDIAMLGKILDARIIEAINQDAEDCYTSASKLTS